MQKISTATAKADEDPKGRGSPEDPKGRDSPEESRGGETFELKNLDVQNEEG